MFFFYFSFCSCFFFVVIVSRFCLSFYRYPCYYFICYCFSLFYYFTCCYCFSFRCFFLVFLFLLLLLFFMILLSRLLLLFHFLLLFRAHLCVKGQDYVKTFLRCGRKHIYHLLRRFVVEWVVGLPRVAECLLVLLESGVLFPAVLLLFFLSHSPTPSRKFF